MISVETIKVLSLFGIFIVALVSGFLPFWGCSPSLHIGEAIAGGMLAVDTIQYI